MTKRRRFKQQLTLQDRLSAWAEQMRTQAETLPPGPEREAAAKKAAHLADWVRSPGLQPPK